MADNMRATLSALVARRYSDPSFDRSESDIASHVARIIGDDYRFDIDSSGVVYERVDGGTLVLGTCLPLDGSYTIRDDAFAIDDRAFMHQSLLETVVLPHGVISIGNRAFFECEHLSHAAIPPSTREIGDEAFCFTSLEKVVLPDNLQSIGRRAFSRRRENDQANHNQSHRETVLSATRGRGAELLITKLPVNDEDAGRVMPPPRFEVSSANRHFAVIGGFLCSRNPDGSTFTALAYSGKSRKVKLDKRVNMVASRALEGAEGVCELVVHLGIVHVGDQGLTLPYPLECLTIDELDGNSTSLYPACNLAGKIAQSSCFGEEGINLPQLADNCDLTLARMMRGYERLWRIIARLEDGRYLSSDLRDKFEHDVWAYLEKNIETLAAHNDALSIRRLVKLGAIDASNIARAIEIASYAGSASATRCLLEERQLRFSGRLLDLEL